LKKLAIVGSHSGTRHLGPFDDPDFEIWVFNEAPQAVDWCKRWDVCFQIHKPEVYTSPNNMVDKTHWDWLQQPRGKKIYMQDVDPRVPDSERYPLDEICETLAPAKFRWITSTPSYAMALALYLGYEHIEVWGVRLDSSSEYSYQLLNWVYWVGAAQAMLGDHLVLHAGEEHFHARLYAYEGEIQIDRDYFKGRMAELDQEWHFAESAFRKAKERLDDAVMERHFEKIPPLSVKAQEAALMAGELAGAMGEAEIYAGREDPISRQEFERRCAAAQGVSEQDRAQMYHYGGCVDLTWNYWKATNKYEFQKQIRDFITVQHKFAYDCGAHRGAHMENGRYMEEYDARLTAAGGERTRLALTGIPAGVKQ